MLKNKKSIRWTIGRFQLANKYVIEAPKEERAGRTENIFEEIIVVYSLLPSSMPPHRYKTTCLPSHQAIDIGIVPSISWPNVNEPFLYIQVQKKR